MPYDDYESLEEWTERYIADGKKRHGVGVCWEFKESGDCVMALHGACPYRHERKGENFDRFFCFAAGPPRGRERSPRRGVVERKDDKEGKKMVTFGKHVGKSFAWVYANEQGYVRWALKEKAPNGKLKDFVDYCKSRR